MTRDNIYNADPQAWKSYVKYWRDHEKENVLHSIALLRENQIDITDVQANLDKFLNHHQIESLDNALAENEANALKAESKPEITPESKASDSNKELWFGWIFVGAIYSFIAMSIESGGDFSRYYRPFEEFIIKLIAGLIVPLPIAGLFKLFMRKTHFVKILVNTAIILLALSLFGSYRLHNA